MSFNGNAVAAEIWQAPLGLDTKEVINWAGARMKMHGIDDCPAWSTFMELDGYWGKDETEAFNMLWKRRQQRAMARLAKKAA